GTHNAWWTPQIFTPIRVGLYPTAVSFAANGDNHLDANEQITITFNQAVNDASVGSGVCEVGGMLIVGFTGTCSASATATIATITGLSVKKTGSNTVTVSTAGAQVTVTLTSSNPGNSQSVSGTGTLTASTNITSSTGGAQACTASFCQLPVTSGF
ncbi:MAG: hypothetical protein ACRDL2_10895, partial [Gaiellaceae bacterium]